MGREIRKVPAGWEHPRQDCKHSPWHGGCDEAKRNGGRCLQPVFDRSFVAACREWKEGLAAWERGERPDWAGEDSRRLEFWEFEGEPPERRYYRPEWTDEERTHFQLYETVSEGTPLSPPMPSLEALARWLADNGDGWGQRMSYEQWLKFCGVGWAPSFVVAGGVPMSGAEFVAASEPSDSSDGTRRTG